MLRILFWNLNRKDLREHVGEAVKSSSSDVVILIESGQAPEQTLQILLSNVSPSFHYPRCSIGRFQVFCRDADLDLTEIYKGDRVSLRRLSYAKTELILGAVHVVDRWTWDEQNQSHQVRMLVEDIQHKEAEMGHRRTILIGDFNMNPFSPAMNLASGMNAMMTQRCIQRGGRRLQGREYHYFYNPMWSLFGDRTPGPSGTYFHSNSANGHYGWNMLDQVLLRPDTIAWFQDVEILTKAGDFPLHTEFGRPNKAVASDHFPILLTLK